MLPPAAPLHYRNIVNGQLADNAIQFNQELEAFERTEHARNAGSGAGHHARLAGLYAQQLTRNTQTIIESLLKMHDDFGSPLHAKVETELLELGTRTFEAQRGGLIGGYSRRLGRNTVVNPPPLDLSHEETKCRCSLANMIKRHVWTRRNVPVNTAVPAVPAAYVTVSGAGATVLTGSGASATVHHSAPPAERPSRSWMGWRLLALLGGGLATAVSAFADWNGAHAQLLRLLKWAGVQ